jgi:hypothetical protein
MARDLRPWPSRPKPVTVRATDIQVMSWEMAARRQGKKSAGAFLAWAGDVAVLFLDALHEANIRKGLVSDDAEDG